ncbi:hypothetical protein ACFLTN_01290 [Chloroflexota bacterium]
MNSTSNAKQSKPIIQKATYSLILGIISIVLPYIIIIWQAGVVTGVPVWVIGTLGDLLWLGTGLGGGSAKVFLLCMIVAGMCAVFGLIFGIQGLKSTRRKLAIAGITVCTISLLLWKLLFLVWLMGGGPIYL